MAVEGTAPGSEWASKGDFVRVSDSPGAGSPVLPLLGVIRGPAWRVVATTAAFAAAFAADQLTGNRWTAAWGSGAIVSSLVAVVSPPPGLIGERAERVEGHPTANVGAGEGDGGSEAGHSGPLAA